MDPCRILATSRAGRLPRTRGDGPPIDAGECGDNRAPPHTRGWTCLATRRRWRLRGSPAHAGMDLSRNGRRCFFQWLPRTRGDGPLGWSGRHLSDRAPPHTRGWTRAPPSRPPWRDGSPAHAGMDPCVRTLSPPSLRLPRTRGDGPDGCGRRLLFRRAPPHTRGWTQNGFVLDEILKGSPAHAGMDLGSFATTRAAVGSPAHAGMDPMPQSIRWIGWGLPRTRGDGPSLTSNLATITTAPPHTRGWTRIIQDDGSLEEGSPAHAGMDPDYEFSPADMQRLPRTRGDGPC